MTDKPRPPMVHTMTTQTAGVFIATELLRYVVNGDQDGLDRDAIAATLSPPQVVAEALAFLSGTLGRVLAGFGHGQAHALLDWMLTEASFRQLTDGLDRENGTQR